MKEFTILGQINDEQPQPLRMRGPLECLILSSPDLDPTAGELLRALIDAGEQALEAYLPRATLEKRFNLSRKKMDGILRKNPTIRTRKPSKQRFEVHVGDFLAQHQPAAQSSFTDERIQLLDSKLDVRKERDEVQARYEEERRRKAGA
jgi:hypothetical protein